MTNEKVKNDYNIFNSDSKNLSYWDAYLASRAKYSPQFYEQIFKHHEDHSSPNSSSLAHDVATGPGQVARVLASRFSRVVATDIDKSHIDAANELNADLVAQKRIAFSIVSAEDLLQAYPDDIGTVDILTLAEAIPLIDSTAALSTIAQLLIPGGTCAIWFYGRPFFTSSGSKDASYSADKCSALYSALANAYFTPLTGDPGLPEKVKHGWKRASTTKASWLDNLAFSEDTWAHVERHKWNTSHPMVFYDPEACGIHGVEAVSNVVREVEKTFTRDDETMWAEDWGIPEVERFFRCNMPHFWDIRRDNAREEIGTLYDELEKELGGVGVRRSMSWPVVLVLATKK